jgi:MoxR-like ATPase
VLTSNNTRELSEALKRRCLYLYVDYPNQDAELDIVRLKVPDLNPELARQAVAVVHQLRNMDLRKVPSDQRNARLGARPGDAQRHRH